MRNLQWGDVDADGNQINISRRADRYNVTGPPKSKAGRRAIPCGPYVLNALNDWRGDSTPADDDLVWPTKAGTVMSAGNFNNRCWYPLLDKLELRGKIRWHWLRHYAVSNWISRTNNLKAISVWTGHANVALTINLYGHLIQTPEHADMAAEIENSVMAK
jgi:integrase